MRKLLYLCLLFAFSCTEDFVLDQNQILNDDLQNIEKSLQAALKVCNSEAMPWLSEMLQKAEEDRLYQEHMGQYTGYISVVQYKKEIYFYTTFPMGSGGIYAYIFDCNGTRQQSLPEEQLTYFHKTARNRNLVIYSTIDF